MEVGVFMMPSHPPERDLREGFEWDLEHISLCDRLGFSEAWIGEHYTAPWEPNPAPDLLIAQALLRTERICCPITTRPHSPDAWRFSITSPRAD